MKKISAFLLAVALFVPALSVRSQEAIRDENGIPGSGGKTSSGEYRAFAVEDDGTQNVNAVMAAATAPTTVVGAAGAELSKEAKQDDAITELQAILAKILAAPSTEAKQDDLNALIVIIDAVLDAIKLDTANISSDQSTATLQTDLNALIVTIDAVLDAIKLDTANLTSDPSTATLQTDLNALIVTMDAVLDAIKLDTANISSDQATATLQTTGNAILTTIDADTGNIATSTASIDTDTSTIAGDTTSIDGKIDNGGGVEAGAVLVTVASDSTGLLSIDDNGGSITVDSATFATEATLATIDTDTGNIATSVSSIDTDTSTIASDTTSIDTDTSTIASDTTSIDADTTNIELNTDTGTVIDHAKVTVGASATLIAAADTTRRSITIINSFTNLVAIGNSDVTLNSADATDGFVLASGTPSDSGKGGSITLNTTSAVYGIGASASSRVIFIVEKD